MICNLTMGFFQKLDTRGGEGREGRSLIPGRRQNKDSTNFKVNSDKFEL